VKPCVPILDEVLPLVRPDRHVRLTGLRSDQKRAVADRDGKLLSGGRSFEPLET
jgi:hypothetical protein